MIDTISSNGTFPGVQLANSELALDTLLEMCIQCGICSGVCPFGYLMAFPPSRMIAMHRANLFDRVLKTDTLWMCVSCYACTEVCPSKIPLTPGLLTHAKEELINSGNTPAELEDALRYSQRYGNALGQSARKRSAWVKKHQLEIPEMRKFKQPVDVLWFVGDYGSYHPRVQETSTALAKIFKKIGVNFGILGAEEYSDGDSQRLAGERGLFEMLAEKNGEAFRRYSFNEIVTADPHAYNAFKNEYPALGISYPVRHYTEYLFDKLDEIRPLLKNKGKRKVTYHDPCYLGRANHIYEPPRALLNAIPGVILVEMPHNRGGSLCCGGGGGGMWLDGFHWEKAKTRLSGWRVREAVSAGADVLAVACPYETPRFEDEAKTIPEASGLRVIDIAELLAEAMEESDQR